MASLTSFFIFLIFFFQKLKTRDKMIFYVKISKKWQKIRQDRARNREYIYARSISLWYYPVYIPTQSISLPNLAPPPPPPIPRPGAPLISARPRIGSSIRILARGHPDWWKVLINRLIITWRDPVSRALPIPSAGYRGALREMRRQGLVSQLEYCTLNQFLVTHCTLWYSGTFWVPVEPDSEILLWGHR